jgi:hypothetical protein
MTSESVVCIEDRRGTVVCEPKLPVAINVYSALLEFLLQPRRDAPFSR